MNSNNSSSSSGSTCSNTSFVGVDNTAMPPADSQKLMNNIFDAPSYTPLINDNIPSSINQPPPQDVDNNNNNDNNNDTPQQNQEIDTFMSNFMDKELNKSNVEPIQTEIKMARDLLGDSSYPTQDDIWQNPNSFNTNNQEEQEQTTTDSIMSGAELEEQKANANRMGVVNSESFNNNAIMSEIMPNASEVTTSSNYSGDNNQQLSTNYYSGDNQQFPVNNNNSGVEQSQTFMTENQLNAINNIADNMAEVQQQQQQQQQSKLAQLTVQRSLIQSAASGGVEQQQSMGGVSMMKYSQTLPPEQPSHPLSQPPIQQQLSHTYATNTLPIQQSMGGQGVNNQDSQLTIPQQQSTNDVQPKEMDDIQKDEVISLGMMGSWSDDDEIEIVDNPLKKKSKVISSSQSLTTTVTAQSTGVMNNTPAWNGGGYQQQQQKTPQSYVDTYNQARGLSAESQRLHQARLAALARQQLSTYGGSAARTPSSLPPAVTYIQMPSNHTPTWSDILPKSSKYQPIQQQQQPTNTRKRLTVSLINMWEFTIHIENLDYYNSYGSNYNYNHQQQSSSNNDSMSMNKLRAQIKKIAKEHVGQNGRKGAIYEKEYNGGITPDDPILKAAAAANNNNTEGTADNIGKGKWRIPLGAYHTLMTYLHSFPQNVIDGIPSEQLRAATLGRERMDKKSYATVSELLDRGVSRVVCEALAPYQRAGVEFILDKDGRALLADEMGLGKTVQAIAAMSAYMTDDWPLLVLCPSTARYHWEAELRHWMGNESKLLATDQASSTTITSGAMGEVVSSSATATAATTHSNHQEAMLRNDQINVLLSGKDSILKYDGSTRVVICSISLIVNLVASNRIFPGMFRAIIVDESHALKSKTTKRTKAVMPILKAAQRCLLLSGTPALAKPSELWPQLSVLGSRRQDGMVVENETNSGIWCDELEFTTKYVKGKEGEKARLAELHTLLTSTVMIRRMKADILKNLPSKIREKAYIKVEDEHLRNEFLTYMQLLRQGKGVLGKLARQHHHEKPPDDPAGAVLEPQHVVAGEDGRLHQKEVLHHLYNITGRAKVARITKMLQSWLADPTKGKLCIFAHHLDVLNQISSGAGLSNRSDSLTKYIRIDGSTNPRERQEQILRFQTDPSVRIAMLGITAAGVAVTLTASSTVWFTELFWTPAIMIQAEDRCHRIGQQARVRCLYFIGKGTLDEVLWKLIEKKFRDLGEFVEGKENMGIALERELEDEEADDEVLKTESEEGDEKSRKRKAPEDVFGELLDADDIDIDGELKKEIDELVHEEEDMLNIKNEEEEDDPDIDEKKPSTASGTSSDDKAATPATAASSSEMVIELLDDEEEEDVKPQTIANVRERYQESGRILAKLKIDPQVQFNNLRLYTVTYPGPNYGLIMVSCNGRVVVKAHQNQSAQVANQYPKIGSIITSCNGYMIPHNAPFNKVLMLMKAMMNNPPVRVVFAEDEDFTNLFLEDFVPNLPVNKKFPSNTNGQNVPPHRISNSTQHASKVLPAAPPRRQSSGSEVIELLDDD